MRIYLATDHAGLELKNKVLEFLKKEGYDVTDCGAHTYDKDDDYPDFISKAAEAVSKDPENSRGVVIGGSGQGEAMVANKFKGVRCALFYSLAIPAREIDVKGSKSTDPYEMLKLTREHNNSNMLSIGARFLTDEQVMQAIKIFLESPHSGDERHKRRIEKIKAFESRG